VAPSAHGKPGTTGSRLHARSGSPFPRWTRLGACRHLAQGLLRRHYRNSSGAPRKAENAELGQRRRFTPTPSASDRVATVGPAVGQWRHPVRTSARHALPESATSTRSPGKVDTTWTARNVPPAWGTRGIDCSWGEARGLDRVLITWVSPVVLADITSGYDLVRDISLEPGFADLGGFHVQEIRNALTQIVAECGLLPEQAGEALDLVRTFTTLASWDPPSLMSPMKSSSVDPAQSVSADPMDLWFYAVDGRLGQMVIEMELAFAGRLDEHLLARATELLLDTESVLGCRLNVEAPQPRWQPVPSEDRARLVLTDRQDVYDGMRCEGLDAAANVQVALCLWRHDEGDRLLVKMTHAVGDGAALQSLVARLASIYSGLCADPAYQPRPSLQGQRRVEHVFSEVPRRVYRRALWSLVWFLAPRWFPRSYHVLSLPRQSAGGWVPVVARVPAERLPFLSAYAKARGATLNDLFLAAAYRALAREGHWDSTTALRIAITIDLRRWYLPPAYAGSIRNLSSLEFPFLGRDLGTRFDNTLANVSALTRRRKRSRPGLASALMGHYRMLRLGPERILREAGTKPPSAAPGKARRGPIWHTVSAVLSNEGRLDEASLCFGSERPESVHILPPFLALPGVHLSVSSYRGVLAFAAVTPRSGYAAIERFLSTLVEQLPQPAGRPGLSRPAPPGHRRRRTSARSRCGAAARPARRA